MISIALCAMLANIARTLVNTTGITGWENLQLEIIDSLRRKEVYLLPRVEAMDESIGRVRKAIKEKGIEDNTVIIVLSDQGGA